MSTQPLEIHLADKSVVTSARIVRLPLTVAGKCEREVELYVVPALNHGLILGI